MLLLGPIELICRIAYNKACSDRLALSPFCRNLRSYQALNAIL